MECGFWVFLELFGRNSVLFISIHFKSASLSAIRNVSYSGFYRFIRNSHMFRKLSLCCLIALSLAGCKATSVAPQNIAMTNTPYTIKLPKTLDYSKGHAWGISFNDEMIWSGGTPEVKRFEGHTTSIDENNSIRTEVCKGSETVQTGAVYQSCVTYHASTSFVDKDDHSELTLIPENIVTNQGRSILFLPIALPKASEGEWFNLIADHSVWKSSKIDSEYPSDSIKGNFDRLLTRYSRRKASANEYHRQYRNAYSMVVDGIEVVISADFYPYKNGSLVDLVIEAKGNAKVAGQSIDWTVILEQVDDRIQAVIDA